MGEPHCPFGAGPRICVGYALAQLELVALLHAVLRRYELFPAGPGYPRAEGARPRHERPARIGPLPEARAALKCGV